MSPGTFLDILTLKLPSFHIFLILSHALSLSLFSLLIFYRNPRIPSSQERAYIFSSYLKDLLLSVAHRTKNSPNSLTLDVHQTNDTFERYIPYFILGDMNMCWILAVKIHFKLGIIEWSIKSCTQLYHIQKSNLVYCYIQVNLGKRIHVSF